MERVKMVKELSKWLQVQYSKESLWDLLNSTSALTDYGWDHQCHQSESSEVYAIVLADELVSWDLRKTLADHKEFIKNRLMH